MNSYILLYNPVWWASKISLGIKMLLIRPIRHHLIRYVPGGAPAPQTPWGQNMYQKSTSKIDFTNRLQMQHEKMPRDTSKQIYSGPVTPRLQIVARRNDYLF